MQTQMSQQKNQIIISYTQCINLFFIYLLWSVHCVVVIFIWADWEKTKCRN